MFDFDPTIKLDAERVGYGSHAGGLPGIGNGVAGVCGEVAIGFVWAISLNVCFLRGQGGSSLWTTSFGFGMGVEASGGVQDVYSNAKSPDDLLGWAACAAVGIGPASAAGCLWSNGTLYMSAFRVMPGPLSGDGIGPVPDFTPLGVG
jgi:hypothetical protein